MQHRSHSEFSIPTCSSQVNKNLFFNLKTMLSLSQVNKNLFFNLKIMLLSGNKNLFFNLKIMLLSGK
jgi:hypothetical protein